MDDEEIRQYFRKKVSEMDWRDGCWNCVYRENCWMTLWNSRCMRYKKIGEKVIFKTYDFKED